MTILIMINDDANAAHFAPLADDCAPFEYELMIDGLDVEIREVIEPPYGAVVLDGLASAQAIETVEALPWVKCVVGSVRQP